MAVFDRALAVDVPHAVDVAHALLGAARILVPVLYRRGLDG